MKSMHRKILSIVSKLGCFAAAGIIGTMCRTILYQPKTPQRLLDMDE